MKIELQKITIRELVEGYVDDVEKGVRGYGGRLDIRPPYQREFVYREKERNAVVSTVMKGFPLNVMYWVKKEDGTFEVTVANAPVNALAPAHFRRYVTAAFPPESPYEKRVRKFNESGHESGLYGPVRVRP